MKNTGFRQLIEELAPGGRLIRARRLRGGLGARMHMLDIERADDTHFKVSLRRFVREHRYSTPEHVAHEYRILELVGAAGIAAPRPLLLDAEGRLFGVPAMALTYIPGRPLFVPRDVGSYVKQLAAALVQIHAVTPQRFDLSWLFANLRDGMKEELDRRQERADQWEPLPREVHAVLEREIDRVGWPEATFVHDDYWPGNTVWRFGRLAAVVDWTASELGDPRADVAQCRVDLTLSLGIEGADAFLHAYQSAAPLPLPDIWYFDLFRGLRGFLYYDKWLEGYHDAGLSHITAPLAHDRIETFLRRALHEGRSFRR